MKVYGISGVFFFPTDHSWAEKWRVWDPDFGKGNSQVCRVCGLYSDYFPSLEKFVVPHFIVGKERYTSQLPLSCIEAVIKNIIE